MGPTREMMPYGKFWSRSTWIIFTTVMAFTSERERERGARQRAPDSAELSRPSCTDAHRCQAWISPSTLTQSFLVASGSAWASHAYCCAQICALDAWVVLLFSSEILERPGLPRKFAILDEATSALDRSNQSAMYENLQRQPAATSLVVGSCRL